MSNTIIRPLQPQDRKGWNTLWHDYLAFYKTTLAADIYDSTFARLLGDDPRDFNALVAERDGQLIGLAHYLFHRHAWKIEDTVYLQDLYTTPTARGTGAGRALIEAVYAKADAAQASGVYWMTQDDNATARQLYDRIGAVTPFIKYTRP